MARRPSPTPRARPRRGTPRVRYDPRRARGAARARLSRFRQGSRLAIGVTALVLLLVGTAEPGAPVQDTLSTTELAVPQQDTADTAAADSSADPAESARRATGTLRTLARGFYGFLPALGIALALLFPSSRAFVRPEERRLHGDVGVEG